MTDPIRHACASAPAALPSFSAPASVSDSYVGGDVSTRYLPLGWARE